MSSVTYKLPDLHEWQVEVRDASARHRIVLGARRIGKTRLGTVECTAVALKGGRALWAAPSADLAAEGWDVLLSLARGVPGVNVRLGERRIDFPGGGVVFVKSAAAEGGLRGRGYDLVVLEEAAFCPAHTWTRELRPSLANTEGRALFISTPNGENWFFDLWQRARDGGMGSEWAAFRYTAHDSPTVKTKEIQAAERELPRDDFEQEWLAVPAAKQGRVFRPEDVNAMSVGWTGYSEGRGGHYCSAWDLGRKRDATCGITARYDMEPFQVVAFESERGLPWLEVQTRIETRHREYPGRTAVEVSGVGDVVVGNLAVRVDEFVTTEQSKARAIQAARLMVERQAIRCGESRLLGKLKDATWQDSHHSDEFMAFVILCYHLPRPRREGGDIGIDNEMGDWRNKHYQRGPVMAGVLTEAW